MAMTKEYIKQFTNENLKEFLLREKTISILEEIIHEKPKEREIKRIKGFEAWQTSLNLESCQ